jgi:hypothetical protein
LPAPKPAAQPACDLSKSTKQLLREAWTRWANGGRMTVCDELTLARTHGELPDE